MQMILRQSNSNRLKTECIMEALFKEKLSGIDAEGNEKEYCLSDFGGQTLVLYFYPKDSTPGCTKEACAFMDNLARISPQAQVVGVSTDSIARHQRFREQQQLNFPLLSDPEHILIESPVFAVWKEKSMCGRKYFGIERSTFIIKNGQIVKEWRKVKVAGHADQILDCLKELQ